MTSENLQIPAYIDGASTRKDGSLSIRVSTQELHPNVKLKIFDLLNTFGWFMFKPSEKPIGSEELPDSEVEDKSKTPSKRLRSVLYVLWESGEKKVTFDAYYRSKMEQIIEHVKTKLPPQ